MKKTILIIASVILVVTISFAFKAKSMKETHFAGPRMILKDLSAEQLAEIETKRMTFYLDLTQKQAEQIHTINVENAQERKEMMNTISEKIKNAEKPNANFIQKKIIAKIDKQIAIKTKLKEFFSEKQIEKWTEMQMKHSGFGKPHFGKRPFSDKKPH